MTISLTVRPHTVYILCGPTMCGKSTFSSYLHKFVEGLGLSCATLSSDFNRNGIRSVSSILLSGNREVIEDHDNRHCGSMLAASRQAFDILFSDLKMLTSYPINSEVIIIDTTGFDETFRRDVRNIARNNEYRVELVTFEYKQKAEYIPEGATQEQIQIVERSVDRFRKKILPNLASRDYDARIRIKNRGDWNAEFAALYEQDDHKHIDDYLWNFRTCDNFAVIGDSHECVEELETMIHKLEDEHPGIQIIHVGDYLDKGGKTVEMVDLIYERVVNGLDWAIQANHESYAFKRFTGEISKPDIEMEAKNFSSIATFLENPATLEKFKQIYQLSVPYLVIGKEDDTMATPVVITHAPCSTKYLGKFTSYAIREQRNYRVKDREDFKSWFEELDWFYKEAEGIFPMHVFGHVAHAVTSKNGHLFKNRLFLDTGCVYGNTLSAAIFKDCELVDIVQVPSTRVLRAEKLAENLGYPPKPKKAFDMADYDLDPKDMRLLRQIETNGVKYISGTMSPAPSTNEELEPLQAAFNYYRNKGVTELILQPKYMGSRAQLYLFKDEPEKTFMVSRNGWKIRGVEGKTDEEYRAFLTQLYEENSEYFLADEATRIIFDGELLPWRALGAGLIDGEFNAYATLVSDELESLATDVGLFALKDFAEKLDVGGKIDHLNRFRSSLANFTKDTPVEFKAFDVLYTDGYLKNNRSNGRVFDIINEDQQHFVDLATGKGEIEAFEFFNQLTIEFGLEGVVVKPLSKDITGAPPYMKVRSPEYLRLVYGYDYPTRLERLCRQKNISGKVATSIREHAAATEMLTASGDRLKELVVKMIGEIKSEKMLDPRL